MGDLQVAVGPAARDAYCRAFEGATLRIDAEFYRLDDDKVIASLDAAAARGVNVRIRLEGVPDRYDRAPGDQTLNDAVEIVAGLAARFHHPVEIMGECNPDVLVHAKAAVIDGKRTIFSTANLDGSGFFCPGEVCVTDSAPRDVATVERAICGNLPLEHSRIVAGPDTAARDRISALLDAPRDIDVAVEDLSDARVVDQLIARRKHGHHHDRILINGKPHLTPGEVKQLPRLIGAGVQVRAPDGKYLHEKYIDAGDAIYVGSANLTRNGLEESSEIGVIAPARDFGAGAHELRRDFGLLWSQASRINDQAA